MQLASRSCLFTLFLRRTYTTSTTHPKLQLAQIPKGQSRVPKISTLRPEKLVHSDFLVLAGSPRPTFHTQVSKHSPEHGPRIHLAYQLLSAGTKRNAKAGNNSAKTSAEVKEKLVIKLRPFPAHSQGFLYFHQPQPQSGLPRSASSIRFRCVPSLVEASSSYIASLEATENSTSLSETVAFLPSSLTSPEIYEAFKAGYDLTRPSGIPWSISVPSVAFKPRYLSVYLRLLEDKLLSGSDEELQEYKDTPKGAKMASGSHLLRTLDDVFPVRFDSSRFTVWTTTAKGEKLENTELGSSFFRGMFVDRRNKYTKKSPYTGAAHVRFELAPGIDPSKPVLHIRIVKIIEPVKCVIPDYDGYVHMPKEGELVACGLPGKSEPWICQSDHPVGSHPAIFHALVPGYAANTN